MNERNVAALALILADFLEYSEKSRAYVESAAASLASRGVLVPSSLTDDEVERAWYAASDTQLNEKENGVDRTFCWAGAMRDDLAAIAKGDVGLAD